MKSYTHDRRLAGSLLVLTVASLLSACGTSEGTPTSSTPVAVTGSVPAESDITTNVALTSLALALVTGDNALTGQNWSQATNGYGPVELDTSNGEAIQGDGRPITLNGKVYNRGYGVHATSKLTFDVSGKCRTFVSDIGVDDEVGSRGSVAFKVYGDGVKLYDSGTMTGTSTTKSIKADITGRSTLMMVVTDTGNGNAYDHADWAAPALLGCQATSPAPGQALVAPTGIKLPPAGSVAWDWQIGASSEANIVTPTGVKLMDVDGFGTSAAKVTELNAKGIYTVCYINAGSYQPSLPDSDQYPSYLKIQADPNWPGEYFLDVTDVFKANSVLATILNNRLKMCADKGFAALEPDNLQNDENVSGGLITTQQQIDFNGWIADRAHAYGLAVFQKNGPDKILLTDRTGKMMVEKFDGILNESCQQYSECGPLAEYVKRGKLALNTEYSGTLDCMLSNSLNINSIKRDLYLRGGNMSGYVRQACN